MRSLALRLPCAPTLVCCAMFNSLRSPMHSLWAPSYSVTSCVSSCFIPCNPRKFPCVSRGFCYASIPLFPYTQHCAFPMGLLMGFLVCYIICSLVYFFVCVFRTFAVRSLTFNSYFARNEQVHIENKMTEFFICAHRFHL